MATKATERTAAYSFKMQSPYLSNGRININLARTETLTLSLKTNAEGGENAVHAHQDEDHAFIILEGEVTFSDELGNETKCHKYEGFMIPKGAYYRYLNTGSENLIMLRVGADLSHEGGHTRLRPDGEDIPARSVENHHVDPVAVPNKFWGAE